VNLSRVFSSSVGTKLLLGLTGLALFVYMVLHLAGNALIFLGAETFNDYSHQLISNPLIVPIEIGLLLVFLLHIYKAVTMWMRNKAARPVGYQKKELAGHTSRKSLASSTMIASGLLILIFVIVHVKQFYVIATLLVGLHLRHGIASACQSLGVDHPRYTRRLTAAGVVFALMIGVGLAIIPIWVYFTH
jgi:succinate dehydrogenase / fumarate reductase cytochrome b subunit